MIGDNVWDKHFVHQLRIEPGAQQWQHQQCQGTSNGLNNINSNHSNKDNSNSTNSINTNYSSNYGSNMAWFCVRVGGGRCVVLGARESEIDGIRRVTKTRV